MVAGRLFANVYRWEKVLVSDNNYSEVLAPTSFGIAAQLLCCDDADCCLRSASLRHKSGDNQKHDGSGEEAIGLGAEEGEEASADVEGSGASVKGIAFESRIVKHIGQEEMQGDMGEEWKMEVVAVVRGTQQAVDSRA